MVAAALRAGVTAETAFPAIPEEDEDEVPEGRLLYRRHRARERNSALAARKKAAAKASGRLECEACHFDFERAYGELGKDFVECHHTLPLSATGPNDDTSWGLGLTVFELSPNGTSRRCMGHG